MANQSTRIQLVKLKGKLLAQLPKNIYKCMHAVKKIAEKVTALIKQRT